MAETDDIAAPAPEHVPAATAPALTSILSLQVGAVVIAALYLAREVLVPITVAILLSFVLTPLVDLLRRMKLGRVASVLLSVALAIGIIVLIGSIIGSQVAQLAGRAPEYASTVEKKIETVRDLTVRRVSGFVDRLSHAHDPSATEPERGRTEQVQGGITRDTAPAAAPAAGAPTTPLGLAERYLAPVLSPLATAGIIIVVAIFVLLQKEDLRDRMIRLFGSADLHRTTVALDDAAGRLSRYFLAQLAINSGFGVVIGVGLFLIGVPNPVLWGITSALLRFVPYIGSFISAGLPIALALAVDPGWSMALWTAALYLVVELGISQGLEPVLYGHSTGLSPFAVVVSAIFWSWIWGSVGLVLSMPLTLCLVVLGRYVDRLEFLDIMLGDRPPLTPVESFYQRILAGDADEALEHAELLLAHRSLSNYYDEVALKGLQLAANDAGRGVIGHRQLVTVRNTITSLIGDLAGHSDEAPGPGEHATPGPSRDERALRDTAPPKDLGSEGRPSGQDQRVLCLAGKGPLDEAASAMLAQLLGKHGIAAQVAGFETASREAIGRLDLGSVALICVSYLDISGNPSHLRYLLRRLRSRSAGARILVGLWPANDAVLTDAGMRKAIGADYYVTSLRQAVDDCVEALQGGPTDDNAVPKSAGRD